MPKPKIVLAPDSFKDSISSIEICNILENLIDKEFPDYVVESIPVSDGGEGFLEALAENLDLEIITKSVMGPVKNEIKASYGINNNTAYLEMAQSSGLQHLSQEERDPLHTTTYGLGQLIKDALTRNIQDFVIGIGGSATCDGGAGMAQALGVEFCDQQGEIIKEPMTGQLLNYCYDLSCDHLLDRIDGCSFKVASDVTNPLLGSNGAVYIYAPQKGAKEQDLEVLEGGMKNLNKLFQDKIGKEVQNIPGAGAAGGLGAGLIAFLGAEIKSGSKFILDILNFENRIKNSQAIITGEGQIDEQTDSGKIISELITIGRRYNYPLYAICGIRKTEEVRGIKKILALTNFASKKETLQNPAPYIESAGRELLQEIVNAG